MYSLNSITAYLSQTNKLTKSSRIVVYTLFSFSLAYFLGNTMQDDGLRHIAFAAHAEQMHSWQHVFPYSIFTQADPWFSWHFILRHLLLITGKEQVHILVNFMFLNTLCCLIDTVFCRNTNKDLNFLLPLIVMGIVFLSGSRYLNVRPDNLSGVYVIMALLSLENPLYLFFITLGYSCLYYLFFVQVGFIGLLCVVQKRWLSCTCLLLAFSATLVFYFFYSGVDYLDILYKTFMVSKASNQSLVVNELLPLLPKLLNVYRHFGFYFILLEFLVVFYIIYLFYEDLKSQDILLFLLLTFPLWFSKVRFFLLYWPLVYSFLLISLINFNLNSIKKFFIDLEVVVNKIYLYTKERQWAVLLLMTVFVLKMIEIAQYNYHARQRKQYTFFNDPSFNNKRILSNTLSTYTFQGLYVNPSLQFIPSCDVNGFRSQDKQLMALYEKLLLNKLSPKQIAYFAHKVHANYYFHQLSNQPIELSLYQNQGLKFWKLVNGEMIIFKVT